MMSTLCISRHHDLLRDVRSSLTLDSMITMQQVVADKKLRSLHFRPINSDSGQRSNESVDVMSVLNWRSHVKLFFQMVDENLNICTAVVGVAQVGCASLTSTILIARVYMRKVREFSAASRELSASQF